MEIEMQLDGFKELEARLEFLADAAPSTVAQSLNASAERTMAKSKADYVPVDTGTLRASGNVQTTVSGSVVETTLSYGGAARDYAAAVHETNKNYRNGRHWKYLETPLKADLPGYSSDLAEAMQRLVEGK